MFAMLNVQYVMCNIHVATPYSPEGYMARITFRLILLNAFNNPMYCKAVWNRDAFNVFVYRKDIIIFMYNIIMFYYVSISFYCVLFLLSN